MAFDNCGMNSCTNRTDGLLLAESQPSTFSFVTMSNDTAIGIVYTAMGLFGIIENGITSYFIATDPHMKNPTYYYIVQLGIADAIILIPITVQAGLTTLWPVLAHPVAIKIGAFLVAVGWYPGCLFMVLSSFSRYIQLSMATSVPRIFSRRNLALSISLSWIIPSALYTWFIYWDPILFGYFQERYTWGFHTHTPFGNALSIFNITINSVFAITINIFNLKSLKCVHQLRKQVQSFETSGNMRREVKLFAQCAITGTIYTGAVIYYYVVNAIEHSLVWYWFLITHLLWASNHVQNPIIYFVLNTRLRRRLIHVVCPNKVVQVHTTTAGAALAKNRDNLGGARVLALESAA